MSATLPDGPDTTGITCPRCQQPIDPDCCWCGDPMRNHSSDHTAVPMGCDCMRSKPIVKPYDPFHL